MCCCWFVVSDVGVYYGFRMFVVYTVVVDAGAVVVVVISGCDVGDGAVAAVVDIVDVDVD